MRRWTRLTLVWLAALAAGPASAQDLEVVATTLTVGGAATSPTDSSVRLDGLASSGGTEVLLRDTTSKGIRARLLGTGDIPSAFVRRDVAETIASAWTFSSLLTAPSIRGTASPFAIRNAANSADVATFADAGVSIPGTLGVSGEASLAGGALFPDGTAGAPGGRFAADPDTGFRRPSGNTFDIVAGGTYRLRVDNAGTDVRGTLTAQGAASLLSTLNVTALSTLTGGYAAGANSSIAGNLDLTGTGNVTAAGDVAVGGGDLTGPSVLRVNAAGTGQIYLQDATRMDAVDLSALGWASWTTGWGVSAAGSADFRHLQADELHVRLFIAELQEAHNGGEVWTKSTALLHTAFNCPASGGTVTIRVRDFPSAPNIRAFSASDWVLFKVFSRTDADNDGATDLVVGECVGQVTSYADGTGGNDGTQTWTFTRGTIGGTGGSLSAATSVPAESLALDFGVSGAGFLEATVNDGAEGINGPYFQSVKWTGSPASAAAGKVVTTRLGKLTGITGAADEFGLLAGVYAASNGQYFKASNVGVDLHGIDLTLWEGSSEAIRLRRNSGNPYLSLGDPAPTSFSSGAGIWFGIDGGVAKGRMGNPSGAWFSYDPSNGIRMMDAATVRASWASGGEFNIFTPAGVPQVTVGNAAAIFGRVDTGQFNLAITYGAQMDMRLGTSTRFRVDAALRGYDPTGVQRFYVGDRGGGVYGMIVGDSGTAGQTFIDARSDGYLRLCATGTACTLELVGATGDINSSGNINLVTGGSVTSTGNFSLTQASGLTFSQSSGSGGDTPRMVRWASGGAIFSYGTSPAIMRITDSQVHVSGNTRLFLQGYTSSFPVGLDLTSNKIELVGGIADTPVFRPAVDGDWTLGDSTHRFKNIHLNLGTAITNGTDVVVLDPSAPTQFKRMTGKTKTFLMKNDAGTTCTFVVQGGVLLDTDC